ncbi:tRNA glutamyl-Q(34) synthetase GluQRS [uncultured Litoreibacter sp.]|uniref:tRNA glutamyl-Q(34) synthetase GluQRS n=1 Tax=uncultured Litoreibacter sp. TaxID=1392394 RepID=UPI0026133669|nr:tRNA glutamyl-Q(34) synthetase GluQRS [uncultured Litoreibacter sp.]
MTFTTRFAPSPTGPLHLGHAYSAMLAHDMAKESGGAFLLRIEDIDGSRARPDWEQQIYDDLEWLGLDWSLPVMRQSDRLATYRETINQLWWDKFLYRCDCNRRDIAQAASAPQEGAPLLGPDGVIYPGTCRNAVLERDHYPIPAPDSAALRLDMSSVPNGVAHEGIFSFTETGLGPDEETGKIEFDMSEVSREIGDIVLARKDMGTSYHLSVVLDDAAQGITHVIRGQDLFEATKIHVILQRLLGLPTPTYHHHELIRDEQGKRLAKRDDARAIAKYRADGFSPSDIRKMVGLPG